MKSRREESFKKIEGETFYTSPPYNYRPSIAEYLTSLNVTKNGLIADIMHLDYKGNLKINSIKQDSLQIKLIEDKDLNFSEEFLWNYLKSLEKNGEVDLYINQIPKHVLSEFSALVRIKTSQKFSKSFEFPSSSNKEDSNQREISNYTTALSGYKILAGILLSVPPITFIAIIMGFFKSLGQISEAKIFLRKFVWKYVLISLIYFPLLILLLLSIGILLVSISSQIPLLILLPLLILFSLPCTIWIILFCKYCKISYDYLCWLSESKECGEHRNEWIKFKSFVINNSEIEKQPLGHYKLWGPFYYYTLAVGGMNLKL